MTRIAEALGLCLALVGGCATAACSISVTPLSFGVYDVFATSPLRSVGFFNITCDQVPPLAVTIAVGPSSTTGIISSRGMRQIGGIDVLNYNVFVDPSFARLWGDGISGGTTVTQAVNRNKPWNAPIYGSLAPRQNVMAGGYSDRLLVTVTW